MAYMSLRDKKVAELQRQQAELKKSLLGRKNTDIVSEIPLVKGIMQKSKKEKIASLRRQKLNNFRVNQRALKKPLPKVSIKSFY